MDPNEVRAVCQGVREQVRRVVVGQDAVVDLLQKREKGTLFPSS